MSPSFLVLSSFIHLARPHYCSVVLSRSFVSRYRACESVLMANLICSSLPPSPLLPFRLPWSRGPPQASLFFCHAKRYSGICIHPARPKEAREATVGVPLLSLRFSSSPTALIFEWESTLHVAPAAALPLGDPSFIPHFGLFLFIIISRLGGQLRSENKDA